MQLTQNIKMIYKSLCSFLVPNNNKPPKKMDKKFDKLLLLAFDWIRKKDPPLSLASANIKAACQQYAQVTQLTFGVNEPSFNIEKVGEMILESLSVRPERTLVAVGSYIWAHQATQEVTRIIKGKVKNTTVVMGGPEVTYTPAESLHTLFPHADMFIRGYAENAMQQLLRGEKVIGLYRVGEEDRGEMSQVALDDLPSPMLTGVLPATRFMRWETQRGCPFRCSFCQHREAKGSLLGTRRQMEESRVMNEATWLVRNQIQDLAVIDPVFNAPFGINVLNKLVEERFIGKISLQCRIEMIKDEFVHKILDLQGIGAIPVLEFGIQTIQRDEQRSINRSNNMKKIEAQLDIMNEVGIPYELSFIYGLPNQTVDSFKETVEWARKWIGQAKSHAVARFFPLMLLRGTPMWHNRHKMGLITSDEIGVDIAHRVGSGIPHVISSPTFTTDDWYKMHEISQPFNEVESVKPPNFTM